MRANRKICNGSPNKKCPMAVVVEASLCRRHAVPLVGWKGRCAKVSERSSDLDTWQCRRHRQRRQGRAVADWLEKGPTKYYLTLC